MPAFARVEVVGERIHVRASYGHKDALRAVPGARWDAKARTWTYPKSASSAEALRIALNFELDFDEEFQALLKHGERRELAAAHKTAEVLPEIPLSKTSAWLHQRRAFWFARDLPVAMLNMAMGVGKTKVTVDLCVNRSHQKTLVLCPKSVVDVWPAEFEKHAGAPVRVVAVREGSVTARTKKIVEAVERAALWQRPVVVVVNHDAFWRKPMFDVFMKMGFDFLVIDEQHRLKAPGGKASMAAARLAQIIPHRLGLTGTPMPHSPLDVYAQYRILDPGIFGTSFAQFRARYAVMGGFQGHQVVGYQNEIELNQRFNSIAFSCSKDVLDLPPVMHLERKFTLSPEAQRIYDDLEREFVADVEGGVVTAANALTRLLRLQQLTGGYLPTENKEVVEVDRGKRGLLADFLEDLPLGEPVVVFCRFRRDLEAVHEAAKANGRTSLELSGSRNELRAWQEDRADVLAVQIQSGGVGIDLTRARFAVYYSLGFSLGEYEQSLARVHRPGQTHNTTYVHLVAEKTVDEKVYRALRKRKDVVDYVLSLGRKEDL